MRGYQPVSKSAWPRHSKRSGLITNSLKEQACLKVYLVMGHQCPQFWCWVNHVVIYILQFGNGMLVYWW